MISKISKNLLRMSFMSIFILVVLFFYPAVAMDDTDKEQVNVQIPVKSTTEEPTTKVVKKLTKIQLASRVVKTTGLIFIGISAGIDAYDIKDDSQAASIASLVFDLVGGGLILFDMGVLKE